MFQECHLQKVGFFNEGNTCAAICVIHCLHRVKISNVIGRPHQSTSDHRDFPTLVLIKILDALPSQRPFSLKLLKDIWNNSRVAYHIVPDDDIHSVLDGFFSYIKGKLIQANLLTEFRIAYQCPHCTLIDNVGHPQFDVVPQINIPDQSSSILPSTLLNTFLINQEEVICNSCGRQVRGTIIPRFGKITPICIYRRPNFIPHVQQSKILTKLSNHPSPTHHDIGDLIAVINHRGIINYVSYI